MSRRAARADGQLRPRIGWLASALLVAAVGAGAAGVVSGEWVEGSLIYLYASTLSLLLVALLVALPLPGGWAAAISAVGGALYVGQAVGRVLPPLAPAWRELWAWTAWAWQRAGGLEPPRPELPLWRESALRLATLGERMAAWAAGLVTGDGAPHPVAFAVVSALLLWGCAAWAGWWTARRGRPLLALLPLGCVLGTSSYFSGSGVGWVLLYVCCLLLLLPAVYLRVQEQRWERDGIDYSPEIRFDVGQVAVVVTAGVLVLSLITPVVEIPRLARALYDAIREPQAALEEALERFFGSVEPGDAPESAGVGDGRPDRGLGSAALPRAHLLGGDPALRRQQVMGVCIDAAPPSVAETPLGEVRIGPQYYWRGVTYDTYTGRSWTNGPSYVRSASAHSPLVAGTASSTVSLRQRYAIGAPHGRTLYAVGEPAAVDQPVSRRLRAPGDLVGLEGMAAAYVVWSEVPDPTAADLRAATDVYPPDLSARYLALGDGVPAQVRELAVAITRDAPTPYDGALAIQGYLRQIPYDLTVPTPPPGADVVSYFLFELQRGYCDYAASAFVVLARAAGIPARLAVGYAMGAFDVDLGCYQVTEADGHSWPEVYFPEYGWIAFEPTAAFEPFERAAQAAPAPEPTPQAPPLPRRPWDVTVRVWWSRVWRAQRVWAYAGAGGVLALIGASVLCLARRRRRRQLPTAAAVALCYRDMARLGARLGARRRPSHTPAEYALLLLDALRRRRARWPWRSAHAAALLARAETRVHAVTRAYERASYGAGQPSEAERREVEATWRALRRDLRWMRVVGVLTG
ncbi:MAG: transglutaminase domain-containing protein [Anaerolineae bacterium]|nr:transglutaminase domain-containing protein [Anaerolineae bacterium]